MHSLMLNLRPTKYIAKYSIVIPPARLIQRLIEHLPELLKLLVVDEPPPGPFPELNPAPP